MKKRTLMSVLVVVMVAVSMMIMDTKTACAGDSVNSDWDGFMKQIDPSYAGDIDRKPFCSKVLNASSGAQAPVSDWDRFVVSMDPSYKEQLNATVICTPQVTKTALSKDQKDWDEFLKLISPRS